MTPEVTAKNCLHHHCCSIHTTAPKPSYASQAIISRALREEKHLIIYRASRAEICALNHVSSPIAHVTPPTMLLSSHLMRKLPLPHNSYRVPREISRNTLATCVENQRIPRASPLKITNPRPIPEYLAHHCGRKSSQNFHASRVENVECLAPFVWK